MAHAYEYDPDEEVECPYDRSHRPLRKRLQYHLIDCRKNNPNLKFKICPFNATHHLPEAELRNHVANCPDRAVIDLEREFVHPDCSLPRLLKLHPLKLQTVTMSAKKEKLAFVSTKDTSMVLNFLARNEASRESKDNLLKGYTTLPVYENLDIPATEKWGEDEDDREIYSGLRMPSISASSMFQQPKLQPREQPYSSVFSYSVGRGRGRGHGNDNRIYGMAGRDIEGPGINKIPRNFWLLTNDN